MSIIDEPRANSFKNGGNHDSPLVRKLHSVAYGVNPSFLKAGEITRQTRISVESRDWRGSTYLELCNFVEDTIKEKGGSPAFPCNVCADSSAAHYTAEIGDQKIVGERSILKVDIGAHIDGYPTDTSVTLCYDEELVDLVESAKFALAEALKGVKVGTRTSEIGKIVESFAARRGYLPISNLSGHSLDQYVVHAGTSIPNVWSPSSSSFHEGSVYAIEPFFTLKDGSGIVVESKNRNIFSLVSRKKTKDPKMNEFLDSIWNSRRSLPFAERWFLEEFTEKQIHEMVGELLKMKVLRSYPELVEAKKRPVAQAEHTIAMTAAGALVLT